MTRVLVGAPVRERAWILPTWLAAIEAQRVDGLDVDVCCFWERDPADEETYQILRDAGATILIDDRLVSPRTARDVVEHRWGEMAMYEHMAIMRNLIASYAERNRYEYLFSLDTDIILHGPRPLPVAPTVDSDGAPLPADPFTETPELCDLERFLVGLGPHDVVGPLVNMDRRPYHLRWNYMNWVNDFDVPRDGDGDPLWAARPPEDFCMGSGRHQVDVVLAALLVPVRDRLPRWVAYPQGEDVGWPANARKAGLRLLVDTDIVCRHVMNVRPLTESTAP